MRLGDIVILDNLPAHRMPGGRRSVEQVRGDVPALPPYSPDFNPIEMALFKLESFKRSRTEQTVTAL